MPEFSLFRSHVFVKTALSATMILSAVLQLQAQEAAKGRPVQMPELHQVIVLEKTKTMIRWAAIKVVPDATKNDPYYHAEVFERKIKDKPWIFRRLSHHMVLTGQAVQRSLTDKQGSTYAYKDVEFYGLYRRWQQDEAVRAQIPVCTTSILQCLKAD